MSINANNAALNEILETVNKLPNSKEEQEKSINITENGETVITPDDENTTLSMVTVNVEVPMKDEQSKTIDITENGTTEVIPDESMTLSKVMVNVDVPTGGGDELPDWDDDSPIIASGYGYQNQTKTSWEITEKGTMRWKYDPNGTGSGGYSRCAGWGNSVGLDSAPREVIENYGKIKQLYVPDEFETVYLGFFFNCERVRLPKGGLKELTLMYFTSLKEFEDCQIPPKTSGMRVSSSLNIEKIILSDERADITQYMAQNCYSLKEVVNIENITTFGSYCFTECVNFAKDIAFNPNLKSIGTQSFNKTGIKSAKFQNTDTLPTIANNAFINCKQLTVIYCPWAEGEVANAPWGATNATIHYNTTYDENGNPVVTEE